MTPNRSLTAIPGVRAGHGTDLDGGTGVTAVLLPPGSRGAVCVPGSAPGGREIGALDPTHIAGEVHGFCLAGGSAFGLAAADGVMEFLAGRGVGFDTGFGRVPIVPAAILFDLHTSSRRPDRALGFAAADGASGAPLAEGRVGAATGARVGKAAGIAAPGGFGGWAEAVGPWTVAAGVAVNAFGSVRDPDSGRWVVGGPPVGAGEELAAGWRGQTTLAVVCTDAPLDRAGCHILAQMATAGFARTLWPVFTPFDGDTVFVASCTPGDPVDPAAVGSLGDAAAQAVATAILRAVQAAASG